MGVPCTDREREGCRVRTERWGCRVRTKRWGCHVRTERGGGCAVGPSPDIILCLVLTVRQVSAPALESPGGRRISSFSAPASKLIFVSSGQLLKTPETSLLSGRRRPASIICLLPCSPSPSLLPGRPIRSQVGEREGLGTKRLSGSCFTLPF